MRSAEDVDEAALSYAEIKMLASGNPYIKEKMDLDIQVSRLKVLKQNFLSSRYEMEDELLRVYPQKERKLKEQIFGYQKDMERIASLLLSEEKFTEMTLEGRIYVKAKEAVLTALDPTGNEIGRIEGKETEKGVCFLLSGNLPSVQYNSKIKKECPNI